MIPDRDIWRAANLLIREHGDRAEFVAAGRADEMLERGDIEGKLSGFGSEGRSSSCRPRLPGNPISVAIEAAVRSHRRESCCPPTDRQCPPRERYFGD